MGEDRCEEGISYGACLYKADAICILSRHDVKISDPYLSALGDVRAISLKMFSLET